MAGYENYREAKAKSDDLALINALRGERPNADPLEIAREFAMRTGDMDQYLSVAEAEARLRAREEEAQAAADYRKQTIEIQREGNRLQGRRIKSQQDQWNASNAIDQQRADTDDYDAQTRRMAKVQTPSKRPDPQKIAGKIMGILKKIKPHLQGNPYRHLHTAIAEDSSFLANAGLTERQIVERISKNYLNAATPGETGFGDPGHFWNQDAENRSRSYDVRAPGASSAPAVSPLGIGERFLQGIGNDRNIGEILGEDGGNNFMMMRGDIPEIGNLSLGNAPGLNNEGFNENSLLRNLSRNPATFEDPLGEGRHVGAGSRRTTLVEDVMQPLRSLVGGVANSAGSDLTGAANQYIVPKVEGDNPLIRALYGDPAVVDLLNAHALGEMQRNR